ncbi:hypothetical protein STCU_10474 [Strigomonas culicis]|nr:hypothetical protein STCU_10474 [Strigomonas culicis]|eukprot:EPY17676.1 hypothetical protein STCU_10474 [Strigomonas culicis]
MLRWVYGPTLRDVLVQPSYACDADGNATSASCVSGRDYLTHIGFSDDAFGRFFTLTAATSGLLFFMLCIIFALKKV